jgi:excisionase family DNA binding protein
LKGINNEPDTKRLADAVTALAVTWTEIMTEKLRAIAEIQEQKIAHKTIEPLMSRQQLAEHFGVSQRTIETWMEKDYLPYYKLGRKVLFKLTDVQRHWDAGHRHGARWRF